MTEPRCWRNPVGTRLFHHIPVLSKLDARISNLCDDAAGGKQLGPVRPHEQAQGWRDLQLVAVLAFRATGRIPMYAPRVILRIVSGE